jgi:hypothetical protein
MRHLVKAMSLDLGGLQVYHQELHFDRKTLEFMLEDTKEAIKRAKHTDVDAKIVPLHRIHPSPFLVKNLTKRGDAGAINTTSSIGFILITAVCGRSYASIVTRGGERTS